MSEKIKMSLCGLLLLAAYALTAYVESHEDAVLSGLWVEEGVGGWTNIN